MKQDLEILADLVEALEAEEFHLGDEAQFRLERAQVYLEAKSQNRAYREPKGERPGGGRGKGE